MKWKVSLMSSLENWSWMVRSSKFSYWSEKYKRSREWVNDVNDCDYFLRDIANFQLYIISDFGGRGCILPSGFIYTECQATGRVKIIWVKCNATFHGILTGKIKLKVKSFTKMSRRNAFHPPWLRLLNVMKHKWPSIF